MYTLYIRTHARMRSENHIKLVIGKCCKSEDQKCSFSTNLKWISNDLDRLGSASAHTDQEKHHILLVKKCLSRSSHGRKKREFWETTTEQGSMKRTDEGKQKKNNLPNGKRRKRVKLKIRIARLLCEPKQKLLNKLPRILLLYIKLFARRKSAHKRKSDTLECNDYW